MPEVIFVYGRDLDKDAECKYHCPKCNTINDGRGDPVFRHCDPFGKEVEPTAKQWPHPFYACFNCGQMFFELSDVNTFGYQEFIAEVSKLETEQELTIVHRPKFSSIQIIKVDGDTRF